MEEKETWEKVQNELDIQCHENLRQILHGYPEAVSNIFQMFKDKENKLISVARSSLLTSLNEKIERLQKGYDIRTREQYDDPKYEEWNSALSAVQEEIKKLL